MGLGDGTLFPISRLAAHVHHRENLCLFTPEAKNEVIVKFSNSNFAKIPFKTTIKQRFLFDPLQCFIKRQAEEDTLMFIICRNEFASRKRFFLSCWV